MADGDRDTTLLAHPAQLVKKPSNINGKITISLKHLRWVPAEKGAHAPVSIPTANITGQQKAKGKPFLRIQTSAGSPQIFQFSKEVDRDAAVEVLAPLIAAKQPTSSGTAGGALSSVAKQTGPEAQVKEKLLATDRDLKVLYEQVVSQGMLSDAEFWATRQHLLNKAKNSERANQKAGLSTAMLADIRPTADGQSNRVTFRITPEMVPQIFAEKPEVHKCYLANVPHALTDAEFWKKYVRFEWCRRLRQLNKSSKDHSVNLSVEDQETIQLFEQFRKTEQSEKESQAKARSALPSVNLAADTFDVRGGGYGTAYSGAKEGRTGLARTTAATDIIRDVNRHAAVVLDGIGANPSKTDDNQAVAAALATAERSKTLEQGVDWDAANHSKWAAALQREGRVLPELQATVRVEGEALRIQDARRYFNSSGDAQAAAKSDTPPTLADIMSGINPRSVPCPPLNPSLAAQVLTEVSLRVQAALAEHQDGYTLGDPKDVLVPALQKELRKQALLANELLRHFWALFPVSSAQRAQKLERIKDSLSRQYDTMQAMQEAAHGSDRIYISQVLRPCMQALDAAFTKYDTEQSLRKAKRQKLAAAQPTVAAT